MGSPLAILPTFCYNICLKLAFYITWRNIKTDIMNKNLDITNFAVSLDSIMRITGYLTDFNPKFSKNIYIFAKN